MKTCFVCVTILSSVAAIRIYNEEREPALYNVASQSFDATCRAGSYSPRIIPCTQAIDDRIHPLRPHRGRGWISITMATVSIVTSIEIMFDAYTFKEDYIVLRLDFSDGSSYKVNLTRPETQCDIVRQQIEVPMSANKAVALSWNVKQLPRITEFMTYGTFGDIQRLDVGLIRCLHSRRECYKMADADPTTVYYPLEGETVTLHLRTPSRVDYVAISTSHLSSRGYNTPVTLTLHEGIDYAAVFSMDFILRRQDWRTVSLWQLITTDYHSGQITAVSLTSNTRPINLAEVELYTKVEDLHPENLILAPNTLIGLHGMTLCEPYFHSERISDAERFKPKPQITVPTAKPSTADQNGILGDGQTTRTTKSERHPPTVFPVGTDDVINEDVTDKVNVSNQGTAPETSPTGKTTGVVWAEDLTEYYSVTEKETDTKTETTSVLQELDASLDDDETSGEMEEALELCTVYRRQLKRIAERLQDVKELITNIQIMLNEA